MNALSRTDLDRLVTRLQARRDELASAISDRLHRHGLDQHDTAALPNRSEDTDDWGAADNQSQLDIADARRAADALAAVEAALARVHAGEYGTCDCGEPIPLARLQANPVALRCTECQAAWEHTQARAP